MQSDLIPLAELGCVLTAVLFTALAIRHARKQTRLNQHITELERQLRERVAKRQDAPGETRFSG